MAFADLEQHLRDLGFTPSDAPFSPALDGTLDEIEDRSGGELPEVARWLLVRFTGASSATGAFYADPRYQTGVMLGWFLGRDELIDAFETTRERLPADVVPIANDGGDNYLCVGVGAGNAGAVSFLVHDAPDVPERPAHYPIAPAIEPFLRGLYAET